MTLPAVPCTAAAGLRGCRVPHGDCVVARAGISVIGSGTPTGDELEAIVRRAYEEAGADGRCEPPWPRWRGWVG